MPYESEPLQLIAYGIIDYSLKVRIGLNYIGVFLKFLINNHLLPIDFSFHLGYLKELNFVQIASNLFADESLIDV